ncbi:MAG: NAD(P)-dependent alcohol dehydrogenase [Anaerolineae bacterium]
MKAIVSEKYGTPDVLQFKEVEKPAPKDDEVLIRVHASSVNARDWHLLTADIFLVRLMGQGLFKPKNDILGADVAGRVEAVGSHVTQFRPGDEVFGCLFRYSGRTFAEYVCAGENEIVRKPANLSLEQAAAVPLAAMTALQGLRDKGNIQPGQKVLIQGASGGVGTFAVQLAKSFGAIVTGVCSTRNVDMVRSFGADHVVDYKKEDFTRNGQRYDLILAANGYHPLSDYLRALSPEGTYVVAGGTLGQLIQAMSLGRIMPRTGRQKIFVASLVQNPKDLVLMKELLEAGKVVPVIDACYPLSQTADAFRYFDQVHARGKIVITMEHGN